MKDITLIYDEICNNPENFYVGACLGKMTWQTYCRMDLFDDGLSYTYVELPDDIKYGDTFYATFTFDDDGFFDNVEVSVSPINPTDGRVEKEVKIKLNWADDL